MPTQELTAQRDASRPPSHPDPTSHDTPPDTVRATPGDRHRTIGIVVAIATLQALMVLAFAWPAAQTAPRDLPIVVVGPEAAVAQVTGKLDRVDSGGFDVSRRSDEPAARQALRDRDAYAAIVLGPDGPKVLTASAASPAVAQAIGELAQGLGSGSRVPVEDVVSTTRADPRGAFLSSGVLPIVMTSVLAGALLSLVVSSAGLRAAGAAGIAAVGGLVVAGIGHFALDGLDGSYLLEAGVLGLTVYAITATAAGFGSLFGRAGIALVGLLMMLLGSPLSGAATAPELLPQPWGAFGQLLPPGAGAEALRSVGLFDNAGAGAPLAVLLGWAALGLVLLSVAVLRGARARSPETVEA